MKHASVIATLLLITAAKVWGFSGSGMVLRTPKRRPFVNPPRASDSLDFSDGTRPSDDEGGSKPIYGDPPEAAEGGVEDVVVRKKAGKKFKEYIPNDDRDSLPYEVYITTPPRRKLGTFKLHHHTACGDYLHHRSTHYEIRRVTNHYRYEGGKFVMQKKVAEATELARAASERLASRLVMGGTNEE